MACNTATTNAIAMLRATYSVPFIGIEPAIKPAALLSKKNKIGVLATKGTLTSALFQKTAKLHAHASIVIETEGTGLVELIEAGKLDAKETKELLWHYVEPMLSEDIDALVLGCTHYPYLIPLLKTMVPATVQIIDSGFAVAKQTKAILTKEDLLASSHNNTHQFYTNAAIDTLTSFVGNTKASVKQLDF